WYAVPLMRSGRMDTLPRLAALHDSEGLTTLTEPQFRELTRFASRVCDAPLSGITIVGELANWLDLGRATPVRKVRPDSLCASALASADDVFIIEDARQDPRFTGSEVCFYAGAVLDLAGRRVGVLWVADRVGREPSTFHIDLLKTLAAQVVT